MLAHPLTNPDADRDGAMSSEFIISPIWKIKTDLIDYSHLLLHRQGEPL